MYILVLSIVDINFLFRSMRKRLFFFCLQTKGKYVIEKKNNNKIVSPILSSTLPRLTCKCENTENQGFIAFVWF